MSFTTYGDAVGELVPWLRAQLAARLEPYAAGVTVDDRTPTDRAPHAGPTPLVVATMDPGSVQGRANLRAPIRWAVWHATRDEAHDLVQLVHGLVVTYAGGPVVRSVRTNVAPYVTSDPDTGEPLGGCTVTVNIRPTLV